MLHLRAHASFGRLDEPAEGASVAWPARYLAEGELSRGGMGAIIKAYDRVRGRHVAMKRPRTDGTPELNRKCVEMLEREYRTLRSIRHPRVVEVYEYGFDAAGPYYTMELLDGADLRAASPVPWRALCGYLRDVASSLALLHSRSLVHRDVTTGNIRITSHGGAKLLDFGALASFGVCEQIVGTPSYIAPEALQQQPLDQRLDIFALGATAYHALSGVLPYPAKSIRQLPALWREATPVPISQRAQDVPPELEVLLMSMLSLDPLARPATMAEVIDRLSSIASLRPEDDQQVLTSYLRMPRLVGRKDALSRALIELDLVRSGGAASVLLEGSAGLGKTAVLEELGQEGHIKGMLVSTAQGLLHGDQQFSTCASLVEQCLSESSEQALHALREIGMAWNSAKKSFDRPPSTGSSHDELESIQKAYVSFFAALAQQRPVLLAIDDADRADPMSLSVISSLSKEAARLLIVLSAYPDPEDSQVAMRALRRHVTRVSLRLLSEAEVEDLTRSWFGNLPGIKRLAAYLYEQSAGNPSVCGEQVAELMRDRRIRYLEGTWDLPQEFPERSALSRTGLLTRRVASLSARAHQLALILSAQRGALSLIHCQQLAERTANLSVQETRQALDQLEQERIILRSANQVVFGSDDLRRSLYDMLLGDQRGRVHRELAELLTPFVADDPSRQGQVAYHLLAAGDEGAAARHLKSAVALGTRDATALVRMVPDFAAIHSEYERMGVPAEQRLLATLPLVVAGLYVDPSQTQDPFGRTVSALLHRCTGMALASRLRRYVGAPLAFITGLLFSVRGYLRLDKRRRFVRWLDHHVAFYGSCAAQSAAGAMRSDRTMHPFLLQLLDHGKNLSSRQSARLVYDVVTVGPLLIRGRVAQALRILERLLAGLPRVFDLDADARAQFEGGVRLFIGRWRVYTATHDALEQAAALQKSEAPHDHVHAECLRFSYYLNRGQAREARAARDRIDELSAQHGGHWMPDLIAAQELIPHHLAGDLLAIKECLEQLERAVIKHPGLASARDVARAMYQGHRGKHERAVQLYEQLSDQLQPFSDAMWPLAQTHWAECLNILGRHHDALTLCERALSALSSEDREYVVLYQQLERERAMALMGLGRVDEAAHALDSLIDEHSHREQPLLLGLLHRDRARVALACADANRFRQHYEITQTLLRSTQNPALIAQLRLLSEAARRRGLAVASPIQASDSLLIGSDELLRPGQTVSAVAQRVTDFAVTTLCANGARLYIIDDGGGPTLCASSGRDSFSHDIDEKVVELSQALLAAGDSTAIDDGASSSITSDQPALRALQTVVKGEVRTAGILALANCLRLDALHSSELERYARALLNATPDH